MNLSATPVLRFLRKNISYALINFFGLTLGLTVSILILLYVHDELSYDKYLPGYDQVIRIQPSVTTGDGQQQWATSEGFLIPSLVSMYPEIEAGTRLLRRDNDMIIKTDTEQFSQAGVVAADSTFFKVFPFKFIYGDKLTALDSPDGVVLTKETAEKFFGKIDPVGKILTIGNGTMTVSGVVEDVPPTSHFNFKMVFPLKAWWHDADASRNMYAFYSYVRLSSPEKVQPFVEGTLAEWYGKYGRANSESEPAPGVPRVTLGAMPLSDVHLQSRAEKEFEVNGQMQVIYIFIAVAILILLIAAINYINLSNAMAIRRTKEVGIRKTIGASRRKLFVNFIAESYVFSLLAVILSLVVVALLMPQFNTFTGKNFDLSFLWNIKFISIVLLGWLCLGFLSGFYPAMILSSFNPIQALKSSVGSVKTSRVSLYLRRGLIISQFAISALMIVSAFTIQKQLNFIERRNIGFDKHNVIVLPLTGEARGKGTDVFKNEFRKLSGVESVAATSVVPGKRIFILSVRIPELAGTQGEDDGTREMRVMGVDHDFIRTLGLQIVDGRDFTIDNAADAEGGFLLNEAAVRHFNLKDPVGKSFDYTFEREKKGKIIGVVKDFNFASVHTSVEPVMMHIFPPFFSNLCIRLKPGDVTASIEEIERQWKSLTSTPFSYYFLDASYDALYRAEKTTGQVITYFTVLALVIACLGLFGIVSFFVTQRTREVGIRKVFGATQGSLLNVLSHEYVIMVIVANMIALYPAYWLVNQWLQQFAYRIDFSFSTFAIAFVVSELMALVSIIYIILKTAKINPATILRHE